MEKTGIQYEADPRHIEIIVEQLGLQDSKAVSSPGTKEEGKTQHDNEEKLSDKHTSRYRAIAARCKYIAPDRPDIAYAAKECCRHMASPTTLAWQALVGIARYLAGRRFSGALQGTRFLGTLPDAHTIPATPTMGAEACSPVSPE